MKTQTLQNQNCDRKRGSLLVVTMAIASLACMQPVVAEILYQNDFEDDPVGVYSTANLAADWNSPSWNNGVDEGRVSITDGPNAFGNRSLVVTYPEGETTGGKTQWKLDLDTGYEELFLSYRIRFGADFDFVRGGKLPGLIGGAGNTGGNKPNGTDGWSARMMWRTNGSSGSSTSGDTANIVQYVYHPDQSSTFGEDFRWDDTVPTDWQTFNSEIWYRLQHRIVMNTPGQNDGIVQAWLDDQMVLDVQNIRFRDIASLQIDQLYFSTFFGGSDPTWEASKDEQVYYDNFIISTEFITTDVSSGDFNENGTVEASDLAAWQAGFGSLDATHLTGDADGDSDADGNDFLEWQRQIGITTSHTSDGALAANTVPEPNSIYLIFFGAALSTSRRGLE